MILSIILCLSLPLIAFLLFSLIRELLIYLRVIGYANQGIATRYYPFIGLTSLFVMEKGGSDQLARFRRLIEEMKNERCFVSNMQIFGCPALVLLDDALIREFLTHEMDYANKVIHIPNLNRGFAMYNGEKVLNARAIYTKFFIPENLKSICHTLDGSIERAIEDFDQEHLTNAKTDIFSREFITVSLKYVLNCVLLGEDESKVESSHKISRKMVENAIGLFKIADTKANRYTLGYLDKWKLLPETRRLCKVQESIEKEIYDKYLQRLNEGRPKPFCNIVDCLIERNAELRAAGEPELSKEEIIGHWFIFQQAGIDTSQTLGIAMMQLLADHPEIQKRLQQSIDDMIKDKKGADLEYEDFFTNETLDNFAKELLRFANPNSVLNIRLTKKDFKLDGIKVSKNTVIIIPNQLNMTSSRYFVNPEVFDL